jgi:hypothetical protein
MGGKKWAESLRSAQSSETEEECDGIDKRIIKTIQTGNIF